MRCVAAQLRKLDSESVDGEPPPSKRLKVIAIAMLLSFCIGRAGEDMRVLVGRGGLWRRKMASAAVG